MHIPPSLIDSAFWALSLWKSDDSCCDISPLRLRGRKSRCVRFVPFSSPSSHLLLLCLFIIIPHRSERGLPPGSSSTFPIEFRRNIILDACIHFCFPPLLGFSFAFSLFLFCGSQRKCRDLWSFRLLQFLADYIMIFSLDSWIRGIFCRLFIRRRWFVIAGRLYVLLSVDRVLFRVFAFWLGMW